MIKKGLLFVLILLCLLIIPVQGALYLKTANGILADNLPNNINVVDNTSTYWFGGFEYWKNPNTVYGLPINLTTSDLFWRLYTYSSCSSNVSGYNHAWVGQYDSDRVAYNTDLGATGYLGVRPNCSNKRADRPYFNVLEWTGLGTNMTIVASWNIFDVGVNSSYGNLTVNVKDATTLLPLSGATVNYFYTPLGSITGTSNVQGNVTFSFVETNATAQLLTTSKSNYVTDNSYVTLVDSSAYKQVYLSSTGVTGDYYITVSPAWIPSDGTQYLYGQLRKYYTGETNLSEFKTLSWSWHKIGTNGAPDGLETPYIETTNSSNHLTYSKSVGIYKGWSTLSNAFTNVKTGALPNPLSLNPIGATGSILTTLTATDESGNNYLYSVSNLIGDNTTSNNVKFIVQDAYTGYRVYPSQLSVRNDATGVWWNVTTQYGEYEFILPVGAHVTEFASANGYTNVTNNIVIEANMIRHVNMYPSSFLGSPDKSELLIYVRSSPTGGFNSLPLEDSYVSITQVNNSIVKSDYTGVTGIVSFSVNKSTAYTITASKTGYTSGTQTINTAFINPYEAYIYLTNLNVISPTITPTPFITVTPVQTVIGGAVRNLTAYTCGVPTGSMTIVEIFKQNIACWGVETREAQDLVLAGIIIAFFAFVLSKWGKGLGALIGGSIGFVLSLAAGLIPVWVFFALVIIAGLIFGLKLYGSGK